MSVDTSSILYQIGQAVKAAGESGGNVDLSDIETRLTAAESEIVALGGQTPPPTGNLTVADVQWTNLTEINLSGEKILNGSFEATNIYTENPTVALAVGQLARINTAFSKNNVDYAQFEIVTISTVGTTGNIQFEKADGTKAFIGSNNQTQFQRGNLWEVVDVAPNYQLRPDLTPAVGQTVKILQDVTYTYGSSSVSYTENETATISHLSVPNALGYDGSELNTGGIYGRSYTELVSDWTQDGESAGLRDAYSVRFVGQSYAHWEIRLEGGKIELRKNLLRSQYAVGYDPEFTQYIEIGTYDATAYTFTMQPGWTFTLKSEDSSPNEISLYNLGPKRWVPDTFGYSASGVNFEFIVEPGIADRGTKWEIVSLAPVNWEIVAGDLDPTELAAGNINGLGDNVALIQRFSEGLTEGDYQVNVGRQASQTQSITLTALKFAPAGVTPQSAQVVWTKNGVDVTSSIITVFPGDNVSFNPSEMDVHGIKINTDADARTITDISIFKGETSGGTVEVTGNSIRKINGTDGFNSGASSIQSIPDGENGYFQFQYGGGGVRIGATYLDTTYSEDESPADFQIEFSGSTITGVNYTSGSDFVLSGDFFRIRHYSTTNQLQFQKRQDVYASTTIDNTNLVKNDGNNHIFPIADRPFVRALIDTNGLVEGNIYRLHSVSTTQLRGTVHELDGTEITTIVAAGKWEVVTVTGQDYITFFTPSLFTTNGPLFLDVSLSQLTSQINDAKIATLNT